MRTAFRSVALSMRTSPALYAVPVLIALEVGVVLIEGREWTSEWRWAVDWTGAGVFLSGPLAGGIAAWQAQATLRAPGEAAQVAGAPARIFAFNAGGVFAWAAVVHTLVLLAVVVTCYQAGPTGWPNVVPILLHWSLLAACVAIGYILGQFSESRLLPPLATVGLVFFMIQASNGALPMMWVEVAGATAPLAGLRYRPEVVAGQMVMFWGLALIALGVTRGAWRRASRIAVLAGGSLAGVVAATSLAMASEGRFAVVPTQDLVESCFGTSPRVCVLGETKDYGPKIQSVLDEVEAVAGPDAVLPAKYVQVLGTEGPSKTSRQFVVDAGMIQDGQVRLEMLMRYVVWNRNCLLADDPPPSRAIDLIGDLTNVLLSRIEPSGSETFVLSPSRRLG